MSFPNGFIDLNAQRNAGQAQAQARANQPQQRIPPPPIHPNAPNGQQRVQVAGQQQQRPNQGGGVQQQQQHQPPPPRNLIPAEWLPKPPTAAQVVDISEERVTVEEAREKLSYFHVCRFELASSWERNEFGELVKPTWDRAQLTPVPMTVPVAMREVSRLYEESSKTVGDKLNRLNPAQRRQLELLHERLSHEDRDKRFMWQLVQIDHQVKRLDREERRLWDDEERRQLERERHRSKSRNRARSRSKSRRRHSSAGLIQGSVSAALLERDVARRSEKRHKKHKYRTLSITAYYKRSLRPEEDALDIWRRERQAQKLKQQQMMLEQERKQQNHVITLPPQQPQQPPAHHPPQQQNMVQRGLVNNVGGNNGNGQIKVVTVQPGANNGNNPQRPRVNNTNHNDRGRSPHPRHRRDSSSSSSCSSDTDWSSRSRSTSTDSRSSRSRTTPTSSTSTASHRFRRRHRRTHSHHRPDPRNFGLEQGRHRSHNQHLIADSYPPLAPNPPVPAIAGTGQALFGALPPPPPPPTIDFQQVQNEAFRLGREFGFVEGRDEGREEEREYLRDMRNDILAREREEMALATMPRPVVRTSYSSPTSSVAPPVTTTRIVRAVSPPPPPARRNSVRYITTAPRYLEQHVLDDDDIVGRRLERVHLDDDRRHAAYAENIRRAEMAYARDQEAHRRLRDAEIGRHPTPQQQRVIIDDGTDRIVVVDDHRAAEYHPPPRRRSVAVVTPDVRGDFEYVQDAHPFEPRPERARVYRTHTYA